MHSVSHAKLAPGWVLFCDPTVFSAIYYYCEFWSVSIPRCKNFFLGVRLQEKWSCPSQLNLESSVKKAAHRVTVLLGTSSYKRLQGRILLG